MSTLHPTEPPELGQDRAGTSALARLRELQQADLPVHGGTTLAYVYASGLDVVDRVGRGAVAAYAGSNGLDPTAFPSLMQMENEVVGFTADLLHAPHDAVGTVTSGGTESVLLAVQAARDAHPEISDPSMVIAETAHAAFHKASHYFGVRTVVVGVGDDFRPDPAEVAAAIDDTTVLVVASAPSYAHGVIDPVSEIAAAAAARGVRCHVDACIGGWILPYAERLGRPVRPWDFRVEGVTSISVDTHKYAYAPKGTSVLLHRSPELRRPQFFASAQWPGYTVVNATMQSTKSGGPLAGTWAVLNTLGDEGYLELTRDVLTAVDAIVAGVKEVEGLRVVAEPDSTLVAIATDDSCDPYTITDEMASRGWFVQPQMSFAGRPATVHLSVSAAILPRVDDFLTALGESVAAARELGAVKVDPGVAEIITSLDPARLSEADFDHLLAMAGASTNETGQLTPPQRMAEVNALLDVASPELREVIMVAFLDRLARPVRGLAGRTAEIAAGTQEPWR